jgi:hypothetical protein
MDDHLIHAMMPVIYARRRPGRTVGLGKVGEHVPLVRRKGWLK